MTEEAPTKAIIEYIEATVAAPLDSERVRFKLYDEGFVYEDENIKVTPFSTGHLRRNLSASRPDYGFLVECDGKRVVFSGDLSIHLRDGDFPKIALEEEIDLVICEMAHFSPEEVRPFVEKCKSKELCFNHVYPFDKFDAIKEMNQKHPINITIAHDGDVIEM